jgi:hypothetical protein
VGRTTHRSGRRTRCLPDGGHTAPP